LLFACLFLLAVIEKETPEASKTTLLSLCRTRWVERHDAHEVFFALLPSILRALEAMSNERLFADQFGVTAWNWDTDSKSKANSLLHAISNFEFIITHITTMKCLSILQPLSIKLQKRDVDVYEAYSHIKDFKGELRDIRGEIEKYCSDWYSMATTTARKANIEPSMPRVVGRQQHRSNVEAGTPKDYYKRALTIPLLDHLISEIDTYFDTYNDAVMSSLLYLLPALLVSRDGNPVQAALQYNADDQPSPQVFDVELFRWRRKCKLRLVQQSTFLLGSIHDASFFLTS